MLASFPVDEGPGVKGAADSRLCASAQSSVSSHSRTSRGSKLDIMSNQIICIVLTLLVLFIHDLRKQAPCLC